MARGRKKDITMQPSRALTIQRAYRDRKAKYVADLEERCRKAEAENERLRDELALALANSQSTGITRDVTQQCADLMQSLARTQESLARFQDVALRARDPRKPSPAELDIAAVLTHVLRQAPPSAHLAASSAGQQDSERSSGISSTAHSSIESDTESCCGGYINCEGLIEETKSMDQDHATDALS